MDLIIEGCEIFPVTARRAVERQTQYDADDPKPAPTGKDVFTTTENEGTLEKKDNCLAHNFGPQHKQLRNPRLSHLKFFTASPTHNSIPDTEQ